MRSWKFSIGRRRLLQTATAVGFTALGVFPQARKAYADGYDIWTGACPSYASDHDCSPGCGPSAIYGDACETSGTQTGFHKDDGVMWTLRPNQCYAGSYDGWLWRYDGVCGSCGCHVERRCHDGYRSTTSGWVRSICRWNTECGCQSTVDWVSARQGDSGDNVTSAQYLLTYNGFTVGVTGTFGSSTRQQVVNFQLDNGITADGVIGASTWALLVVTVRSGDRNDAVRAAQVQLSKHGYALAVDGVFGPITLGDVGDFQRKNQLTADGVVGQNTWRTLTGGAA
ncbi:peptidoglycan-binding domain-containing protein [Flindersiella endophytica]